jgi:hypothetical protein
MANTEIVKLISILQIAASEMDQYGNAPILSDYDTCSGLSNFIRRMIIEIKDGNFTNINKLWGIFAPTSDWDDAGGSVKIGNDAFELIDKLFGQEIKNTANK